MTATLDGGTRAGVLYCSCAGEALPWIFESAEDADAFVEAHGDIRGLGPEEQRALFDAWQAEREAAE
jgi:hypothetical protein